MINNQQLSAKEYTGRLEQLNIFINSKNFLVYQGKVEEIALKNPKERMHMFEEISESVQFKEDYIKGNDLKIALFDFRSFFKIWDSWPNHWSGRIFKSLKKASKEQHEAEEESKDAHMKKKGIAQERREAKAEKEQAEIYERMLQG